VARALRGVAESVEDRTVEDMPQPVFLSRPLRSRSVAARPADGRRAPAKAVTRVVRRRPFWIRTSPSFAVEEILSNYSTACVFKWVVSRLARTNFRAATSAMRCSRRCSLRAATQVPVTGSQTFRLRSAALGRSTVFNFATSSQRPTCAITANHERLTTSPIWRSSMATQIVGLLQVHRRNTFLGTTEPDA
jgi:hypothetical protein